MKHKLSGILPVLPTPFSAEGKIDRESMRRIVEFALDMNVAGVVFPGFASEVETLSTDERTSLLDVVVQAVDGRVPIIAGASAPVSDQVIEHGRVALARGVDHLMIQPPQALGAEEALDFFAEIGAALPNAKIILQNAPAPRGSDLSAQAIVDIVNQVPQVVYVKEETLPAGPSIQAIIAAAPVHLKGVIGGGGSRYILDEYKRGACAAMPALEIADIHVQMDKAWREGNHALARELYVRSLPLLVLQAVYRMRLTKFVLMRRGVMQNAETRASGSLLDAAAMADIEENMAELGVLISNCESVP